MSDEKAIGAIEYQSMTGDVIKLSPAIIRKYLVNGQGEVTDQEIMMFLSLCKYQKLNPFLREAYLIKYGDAPATIVTGKETFLKRAAKNPHYQGHKTGIGDDGKVAWAEVYVEGHQVPIRCEVDYNEYVGRTKEGNVNKIWKEKPRTMLKKVALLQALREAFPADFGGMYGQEEINTVEADKLPIDVIDIKPEREPIKQPEAKKAEPEVATNLFVSVKINGVEVKHGKTKNKVWELYFINDSDGEKYSTFSKTLAEEAKTAHEFNKPVEIEYTQSDKGRNIVSLKVIDEVIPENVPKKCIDCTESNSCDSINKTHGQRELCTLND